MNALTLRIRSTSRSFLWIAIVFSIVIASFIAGAFSHADKAAALSGNDFNAGYIIDDSVFYNQNALQPNDIQSFLNQVFANQVAGRTTTCDTNGTQPASDFGRSDLTHAQYAAMKGWSAPPYTCLKDYKQNTPQMEAASGLCNGISAASNISSSQIIYNVAQACHINPQVLIVLLQKEQSLVYDTWPLSSQFTHATGFACPDTAACDPSYGGFFYQVYYAARQFQIYAKYPNNYNYIAGRTNNIYYNPGPTVNGVKQGLGYCGSSQVYIQNQATAALYIYTPYQPNQAALNNLYGTGDQCSSYGNRNFWRLFNDWFGSSVAKFQSLDTPRWLVLNTDTKKYNPSMNIPYDSSSTLTAGTQLYFVDKIYENGQWYYRTEFDSANGNFTAIPASMVSDIQFAPLDTPRNMLLVNNAQKYNPQSDRLFSSETYSASSRISIVDKMYVNGQWYYRTAFDQANGNISAFKASDLADVSFDPFDTPRYLYTNAGVVTYNTQTGNAVSTASQAQDQVYAGKVLINGQWYYQTKSDHDANNLNAVAASDTTPLQVVPIATPYTIKMKTNTVKYSLMDGSAASQYPVTQNQVIKVTGIETINGTEYYQTEFDKNAGLAYGILVSQTTPQDLQFVRLDNPRYLSRSQSTQKTNLQTGQPYGDTIAANTPVLFTTKTQVDGVWYLRTQFDTDNNSPYGIPASQYGIQM